MPAGFFSRSKRGIFLFRSLERLPSSELDTRTSSSCKAAPPVGSIAGTHDASSAFLPPPSSIPSRKQKMKQQRRQEEEEKQQLHSILSSGDKKRQRRNNIHCPNNKKRVRFIDSVSVRPSLHLKEYTNEERRNSWYDGKEIMATKKFDITPTVRLVQNQMNNNNNNNVNSSSLVLPNHLTFRGLEHRTRVGAMQRRANKLTAMIAVLNEQERQRTILKQQQDGQQQQYNNNKKSMTMIMEKGDELIRQVYLGQSKKSLRMARQLGAKDAIECGYGGSGRRRSERQLLLLDI